MEKNRFGYKQFPNEATLSRQPVRFVSANVHLADPALSHQQHQGRSLNFALFYRLLIITDY